MSQTLFVDPEARWCSASQAPAKPALGRKLARRALALVIGLGLFAGAAGIAGAGTFYWVAAGTSLGSTGQPENARTITRRQAPPPIGSRLSAAATPR